MAKRRECGSAQVSAKARHLCLAGRRHHRAVAFEADHGECRKEARAGADPRDHPEKPRGRIGIEDLADEGGGGGDAEDHQEPGDRCCRGPPFRPGRRSEEGQQRCGRGAGAGTDQHEACPRERQAGGEIRLHPHRAEGRDEAAEREHEDAAEDPGGAPPPGIGAVAPDGPRELERVIYADEQSRQHGGEREFDHHDPVERRGGERDHRADRHLDEAEAQDAGPAQTIGRHVKSSG